MLNLGLGLLITIQLIGTEGFGIQDEDGELRDLDYVTSGQQHDGPTYLHGNQKNQGDCVVPESWHGRWFQSGLNLQGITIDAESITTKGVCLQSHQDKFLFYDKSLNCHKCLVINERHRNVLQYKESPDCESDKDSLEFLCSSINGDAQLFSLFRLDAQGEECPFRGAPFNLSYNRGHGECREPISRVESCTQPSTLALKFQACPNVEKTESKIEELECLAHWREGSSHYLMGKLEASGPMRNSNPEETYRCFIWEKIRNGHSVTVGYRVAQSGDATCAGVQSATEGARALTLAKLEEGVAGRCKFPPWLTSYTWHSLDGKLTVKAHSHKNSTLLIGETQKMPNVGGGNSFGAHQLGTFLLSAGSRVNCQSRLDISNHHLRIFAQIVQGCKTEFVCLSLWRRDSHLVEIELRRVPSPGDCLSRGEFPPETSDGVEWLTLLASSSSSSHRCPTLGKYMASGVNPDGRHGRDNCGGNGDFKAVAVGCGDSGTIEFQSNCANHQPITSYRCHGSWREGETGFLIASPTPTSSAHARRFCFVYTESGGGLQVSSSTESCRRNINPGVGGNWAFNLTTQGPCAEMWTSRGRRSCPTGLLPLFSVILILSMSTLSKVKLNLRVKSG